MPGALAVDLQGGTKKRFQKPFKAMSPEELGFVAGELREVIDHLKGELDEAKKADPFWYYKPSDGDIPPAAREILTKYLKPEDIPSRFDGQLHVHRSKANIKLVSGGNQSGKTTTCAIEAFIKACRVVPFLLQDEYPKELIPKKRNNRVRVVCEDYTHGILNHNLPVYKSWVPREYLIDGKWEKSYSDKKDTLTLVDPKEKAICGTIEFMTNQAAVETFQGPPVDKIIYDEEPRKDIYDENLMRFVTVDRLDIMFGMTPTNGLTWVYDEIFAAEKTESGDAIDCFQIPSIGNANANLKVLRDILDRIKVYDHLRMRLLGEWISLSGLVYGGVFKKWIHVLKPERLTPDGGYLQCNCPHVVSTGADPRNSSHNRGCPYLSWLIFRGIDPHMVKATAAVFLALHRDGTHVIDTCYLKDATTTEIKRDLNQMGKYYRMSWSRCDPSADSDSTALDGRNIFRELSTGPDRIPNLKKGEKYAGSIKAGIDVIRRLFEINPNTGKPMLYVADRPENEPIINAFRTLQRDTWANEDRKGRKDAILEGRHDLHAAFRYIMQNRLHWYPHEIVTQDFHFADREACY